MSAHDSDKNLVRLCHRLMTATTTSQLAEICREIGFDAAAKGVHLDGPLTPPLAVYLVHSLQTSGKLGEFLTACTGHHIDLGDDVLVLPDAVWEPQPLPAEVTELLDRELRPGHEPYTLMSAAHFTAIDTGCLCWPIPDMVIINSTFPPEKLARLDDIRALLGDRAVAYIGEKYEGSDLLRVYRASCYVVIPGRDQLNALRVEHTRSEDDYETTDLIVELQEVDDRFHIDIVAASDREITLRVRLSSQPEADAFSAWFNAYAPRAYDESADVSDHVGDLQTVRLWWDLG